MYIGTEQQFFSYSSFYNDRVPRRYPNPLLAPYFYVSIQTEKLKPFSANLSWFASLPESSDYIHAYPVVSPHVPEEVGSKVILNSHPSPPIGTLA
jgi:hypothetical protein